MYSLWIIVFALGIPALFVAFVLFTLSYSLRERNIRRRWLVLLWVGGPILLLLIPAPLNILFNIKAYSEKEGRVIDTATGKGMPNSAVIAVATFFGEYAVHGSAHATLYRVITHTDENGNYRIPSHWDEVVWWVLPIPGTEPEIRWTVTVFQPGYAVVGDELAWRFDEYGEAPTWPRSTWFSPSSTWWGTRVYVDPIKMEPVNLSLKESAVYSLKIISFGSDELTQHDPEEENLRRLARDIFLPQVCALNPEATMDLTEAGALANLGEDYVDSVERLRKLEPSAWQGVYRVPILHAKNVCDAMGLKAGE